MYVLLDKPTDSEEIVTGEKAVAIKEGASVLKKSQFLKKTLVRQAKVKSSLKRVSFSRRLWLGKQR